MVSVRRPKDRNFNKIYLKNYTLLDYTYCHTLLALCMLTDQFASAVMTIRYNILEKTLFPAFILIITKYQSGLLCLLCCIFTSVGITNSIRIFFFRLLHKNHSFAAVVPNDININTKLKHL